MAPKTRHERIAEAFRQAAAPTAEQRHIEHGNARYERGTLREFDAECTALEDAVDDDQPAPR